MQRVGPKSRKECVAEVMGTFAWFKNFMGDQVRFLANATETPGDYAGQFVAGYRFPFGPVGVIAPFNFPIKLPVLQAMGALFMGNRPTLKGDSKVSIVLEQYIRMLHYCGLPKEDMDYIYCHGSVMEELLKQGGAQLTVFTGSSSVAEHLCMALRGKVRFEDGGLDWKLLGPDVPKTQQEIDYVAWQNETDSFGHSGQKCSAQSLLFMHKNWHKTNLIAKMAEQAEKRNLKDLTIGPVFTWTNERI